MQSSAVGGGAVDAGGAVEVEGAGGGGSQI
jgi:hypothetical protein